MTRHPDTGKHVEVVRRGASSILFWTRAGKTDREAIDKWLGHEPPGAEAYLPQVLELARTIIKRVAAANGGDPKRKLKDILKGA